MKKITNYKKLWKMLRKTLEEDYNSSFSLENRDMLQAYMQFMDNLEKYGLKDYLNYAKKLDKKENK